MTDTDPIDVVYVGAVSRSGSTLLDRLLGQIPDHFSGGELTYLWKRGWERNELCGCETPFRDCEQWQAILADFRDRAEVDDISEVGRLVDSVTAHWQTPLYFAESLWTAGFRDRVRRARGYVAQLYRSICDVTGQSIIVDSSKFPVYGFFLAGIDDIKLDVVHLIRDSRAVAHSWQRKKERPEIHWEEDYMSRYNPVTMAIAWNVLNLCLFRLRTLSSNYARMNYESLAGDPEPSINKLYEALDRARPNLDFIEKNRAQLSVAHTASGNPMRLKTGELTVELDDDWRSEMSSLSQFAVTGLTWPLLRWFGYQ